MRTKKTAHFALLLALALVLSYFESLIPLFSVIPGGKIGLANIVTMVVFCLFGAWPALWFGLLRCLLSAVLVSGVFAFLYSGAGTVLSVLCMAVGQKLLKDKVSEIGLSILGAVFFNAGQLIVCACVLGSTAIFRYFPTLGIVSSIAGFVTGYIANRTNRYMMGNIFKNNRMETE